MVQKMKNEGLLQKIDFSNIPNIKYIDKDFLKYTLLFKYLKVLKETNEALYKSTRVQLEKSHIGN